MAEVVVMELGVGGPDVDPDPAGAVLVCGANPGPVEKLTAEVLSRVRTADHEPPDVHGLEAPILLGPDPVVVGTRGEGRRRHGLVPGDPGPPRLDRPLDALIAPVFVRPWTPPLIGVLRLQPLRRLHQETVHRLEVIRASPTKIER
jgi:hypothetical protein